MADATPVLALAAVRHAYGQGETATEVLHGIDLSIGAGEFTALIGPSGSGKSTLLNLIGLLEQPVQGEIDLSWAGRPTDFDVLKTRGKVTLDFRDGRFVTASAKSQALRALGVFNVATWQRRMKMNFTDLYRKGVAFDTLAGDLALDKGRLSTGNLVVKGPSAMFEFSGSTDLASEALDTRLQVTLPLNSNLYVGCLAGLPACAGIVAVERLWGQRLEKMTTLVYDVNGTWNDPLVKEVRGGAAGAAGSP